MSESVFDSTRDFAYRKLQATYEYLLELVVSIKTIYSYYYTNSQLKTGKIGTLSFAEPSPLQYSLIQPSIAHFILTFLLFTRLHFSWSH